jgi:hypothetical protein
MHTFGLPFRRYLMAQAVEQRRSAFTLGVMERERLIRLRWWLRGAWMWPVFAGLTCVDALLLHLLPFQGDKADLVPSVLVALLFNWLAVAVLAPLIGWLIRRRRGDLPQMIATDYAGTGLLALVAVLLLAGGLAHHASVAQSRDRLRAAVLVGEDYIGHNAPHPFRELAGDSTTVTIERGRMYRTCATDLGGAHAWCVIVRTDGTAPRVRFAGNEPNSSFAPIKDLGDH